MNDLKINEFAIELQKKVKNNNLPDPEIIDYYTDIENRRIWIDYDIDDTLLEVVKQIFKYNQEDRDIPIEKRKPIKIFIYTYGGALDAMFALIDAIMLSKTPVYTYNMGLAMSAGFQILISGHKRFATALSTALYHSGSGGTSGTFEQTEAQMKEYKRKVAIMQEHCLKRTKINKSLFSKNKTKDWFMSSQEQLEYGVVDKIVNDIDEIYN